MKKTDRGAIWGTRLFRSAGGRLLVKTETASAESARDDRRELLAAALGVREVVADGAPAAALADDRLERVRLGRRLDQHLPADREADPADALRVDLGAILEERDGRVQVALALPAEDVRVAVALALAAAVEEEDAVAVFREHPRLLPWARAARNGDHGGAVLRRDVPALEPQAVARRELDVLVRRPEIGRRHLCPRRVRDDVGETDREQDERPRRPPPRPRAGAVAGSARPMRRPSAATARASRPRSRAASGRPGCRESR